MRLWQQAMISLARSARITDLVQNSGAFRGLASRFVGGASPDRALETAHRLNRHGISSSLFYLGEYVEDPAVIDETVRQLDAVLAGLAGAGLDLHVSVDPTQLGLLIDEKTCAANVRRIAAVVSDRAPGKQPRPGRDAVMLDMEDRSVTEFTLRLHDRLRADGLPVAVTVQSYLHRATDDLRRLAGQGAFVRLVKGAFAEPADVAVRSRTQIDSRYRRAAATLLSPASRSAGTYVSFGTHDDVIIDEIAHMASANGWSRDSFEFEMLFGVRPELHRDLVSRGLRVRLYVPFGRDWFPYAIRRVGESPRNLRFAVGALARRS